MFRGSAARAAGNMPCEARQFKAKDRTEVDFLQELQKSAVSRHHEHESTITNACSALAALDGICKTCCWDAQGESIANKNVRVS